MSFPKLFCNPGKGYVTMYIKIEDLNTDTVNGVAVQLPGSVKAEKETYFEWTPSSLTADYKKAQICGGMLKCWHHKPEFSRAEFHEDKETFQFVSGTALMFFIDIKDGRALMDTPRVVRIQPGTKIIIEAGKGHFVPIAEGDEPLCAVVESPKMEAPKVELPEEICAG